MARWDPWHGCHRISEGCKFCYTHKGDAKRGIDTNNVYKTDMFYYPIEKDKNGVYKLKSGSLVYVCFSSDFLVADADKWRDECFRMIKERHDVMFLFLTKRIDRFKDLIPNDWGTGYDNVIVGVSVENQKNVDYRLSILKELPIKHKNIICQPLIEKVDISKYLDGVELVVVGGESDPHGRVLDYDWVLDIRKQCIANNVCFEFRQCATNFVKDKTLYKLRTFDLTKQAKKANINYYTNNKIKNYLIK